MTMTDSPATPPARRSSLGLIVLWQLFDGPKHVYGIQKLLEQQGKDRVVNVRSRASLYQALDRLVRQGLVEVHETARSEGYPDRIVYAITDAGRDAAREWLREMLRATGGDYPEFIAAVSILFGLAPDDARAQLEQRAIKLRGEPFPIGGVGGRNELVHGGGFALTRPPAHLGPHGIGGQMVSGLMKPARQASGFPQLVAVTGQR